MAPLIAGTTRAGSANASVAAIHRLEQEYVRTAVGGVVGPYFPEVHDDEGDVEGNAIIVVRLVLLHQAHELLDADLGKDLHHHLA